MIHNVDVEHITPFYCCYLLRSQKPRRTSTAYVGSTPHPQRRLRQHNRELAAGGPKRTANDAPWEIFLMVYGFPSQVAALQFEWSWQQPHKSRFFRTARSEGKWNSKSTSRYILNLKLDALPTLLGSAPFVKWPLTVLFPRDASLEKWRKLVGKGTVQDFPRNAKVDVGDVDSLGQWRNGQLHRVLPRSLPDIDSPGPIVCHLCLTKIVGDFLQCRKRDCGASPFHLTCLSVLFLETSETELLPASGDCPECQTTLKWMDLIMDLWARKKTPPTGSAANLAVVHSVAQDLLPSDTNEARSSFIVENDSFSLEQNSAFEDVAPTAVPRSKKRRVDALFDTDSEDDIIDLT